MRIRELLENKNIKDLEFVRKEGDNTVLDFDLIEDVTFFLNNDDNIYRKFVFPAVQKCVEGNKKRLKTSPNIFKQAALEGYKAYLKKFPIRELPTELDEELCNEICGKMHEDICNDISKGSYKD